MPLSSTTPPSGQVRVSLSRGVPLAFDPWLLDAAVCSPEDTDYVRGLHVELMVKKAPFTQSISSKH